MEPLAIDKVVKDLAKRLNACVKAAYGVDGHFEFLQIFLRFLFFSFISCFFVYFL